MAVPIRDLVAQIRLRINSKDVKKVISDARNLKKKLSKELSPKRTQFKLSIDPKNLKAIRDSLLSVKKQIRNSLDPKRFKRTTVEVKKLSRGFLWLKTAIGAIATVFSGLIFKRIADSFSGLITGVAKSSRTIETLSQVTGISQKFIENFSFAAEGIGISAEQSRGALANFTRKIAEGRRGSEEAAEAFGLLRVRIFDSSGEAKSATQLLSETSRALTNVSDPSERARLATKLFGESAASLLPVLSGAEGSIEDAGRRLDELGGRLSKLTKDESNDFLRSMRDIKFVFNGLKDSILQEALPPLNEFLTAMLDLFKVNKDIINQNIREAFESFKAFIQEDPSEKALEFFEAIKSLPSDIRKVISVFERLDSVFSSISDKMDSVSDFFSSTGESVSDSFINSIGSIRRFFGSLGGFGVFSEGNLGIRPRGLNQSMAVPQSSGGTSVNSPTSVNIEVNAQSNESPQELSELIAARVEDAINSSNRDAIEALGVRS